MEILVKARKLRSGMSLRSIPLFFVFQAEDGIRDWSVTGFRRVLFRSTGPLRRHRRCLSRNMHTISQSSWTDGQHVWFQSSQQSRVGEVGQWAGQIQDPVAALCRSEERRVGKEGRFRWWPYH